MNKFYSLILIFFFINSTYQLDEPNSLKNRSRQARNSFLTSNEEIETDSIEKVPIKNLRKKLNKDGEPLNENVKKNYMTRLGDLNDVLDQRNLISAPDFQANAAGFILPEYLSNSANLVSSSSNNILNKLSNYDSNNQVSSSSTYEDLANYFNDKNSFLPSLSSRERRKSSNDNSQKNNPFERTVEDQSLFEPTVSKQLMKQHQNQQNQLKDNEYTSNSILDSSSDNQDFNFNNFNSFPSSNDYSLSNNYNSELTSLNSLASLGGIRNLNGLNTVNSALNFNSGYNNLGSLAASPSSLVGTLGGSLNGLSSVVPPGAIVGAPGSSPPPGMKLAGYVTVTNPASNNAGNVAPTNNLIGSSSNQQQMLLNQVINRNPQAQMLAQVMAQNMGQLPVVNPYGNNFQQFLAPNSNSNSLPNNPTPTPNSNSNSNTNTNTNNNSNNNASNGEQTSGSTNRAKFLQRLNPMNLFRRLRTRTQKNNSKNTKEQTSSSSNSNTNTTPNEINNNIPDLEDRSQMYLTPEIFIPNSAASNQHQIIQLTPQQQQLAQQLSAQLAQLNLQIAQQANNKAKFLRKSGSLSLKNMNSNTKKISKRDVSNQKMNSTINNENLNLSTNEQKIKNKLNVPENSSLRDNSFVLKNINSNNDTETAENGFFPVADIYQNYKMNLRPRFRFPTVREQRRISNVHGLHVNTNNFLTNNNNKNNFLGIMGSGNFEVIRGGMLTPESNNRNSEHSSSHNMHPNNNHDDNYKHQNQQNLGHVIPKKNNKFNLDNDFDDDDDDDDDNVNSFNGPLMGNNDNSNSNKRNGVMFMDDDLLGSNIHSNGQGKNLNNGGILGFQGFNSFSGSNQFNALSSASNYNNQQLDSSKIVDKNISQSSNLLQDNISANANQTSSEKKIF